MPSYIISEGGKTAWGGRTVKVELAPDDPEPSTYKPVDCFPECNLAPDVPQMTPTRKRNLRLQARYMDGLTGAQLSREFNLAEGSIYDILRQNGTPMRPPGRRREARK